MIDRERREERREEKRREEKKNILNKTNNKQ
jgi:hypothetical protein